MRGGDPDATIRLVRPGDRRRHLRLWACAAGAAVLFCLLAAWVVRQGGHAAPPGPPLADRAALLSAPALTTTLFRFAAAPDVIVVVFDSLHDQALALNRIGAFVEKSGLPHDRVLDMPSLQAAITASGDSFDTYYLGHDYSAADLRRFFAAADGGHVALMPAETWLRARLSDAGLLARGAPGAVVSMPSEAATGLLDASGRRTILRHELAHGVYFTDAGYRDYVARFWSGVLSQDERAAFVGFLKGQGYDPGEADLMRNECQAYLVFTDDARYFSPAALGLTAGRVGELRRAFLAGLPPGWLATSGLRGK